MACGGCGNHGQVISTELNRTVESLLQQLLFWQERARSTEHAAKKRLVSGLRCSLSRVFRESCVLWGPRGEGGGF
jgi:hypothetical protein